MVKYQALLIGLLLGLLILAAPGPVRADPTPTYTPTPWPIPTRAFQNLRPTPSPWSITPSGSYLSFDGDAQAVKVADTIINGYKWLNFGATDEHGGVLDLILFFAMGFLVIRALMSLIIGTSEED